MMNKVKDKQQHRLRNGVIYHCNHLMYKIRKIIKKGGREGGAREVERDGGTTALCLFLLSSLDK